MCNCPGCDEMSCGLPDCDECEADQVPKMSKEERAELEARLAADDADDDDDDEVEVGFGDGSYVKGKYRRVSEAAAARGFKLKPDPAPDKPAKDDGNVKRFSGRRVG